MASVKNSKACLWKVTILADWNLWGPPTTAKIPFKIINKWLKYARKHHFLAKSGVSFQFCPFLTKWIIYIKHDIALVAILKQQ